MALQAVGAMAALQMGAVTAEGVRGYLEGSKRTQVMELLKRRPHGGAATPQPSRGRRSGMMAATRGDRNDEG